MLGRCGAVVLRMPRFKDKFCRLTDTVTNKVLTLPLGLSLCQCDFMALTKTYSASSFALEIDGQAAGWLASVEGGSAFAEVVEKASANGPTDKSIAGVQYDDIILSFGVPTGVLADWVTKFLQGQAPTHDGAVAFLDINYNTLRRLEWERGAIVALTFPALDAAAGKEIVKLTIAIRPEVTRMTKGPSAAIPTVTFHGKTPTTSNFSVTIPGVGCTSVVGIEPVTITQTYIQPSSGRGAPKPGPLEVSDLVITVSASGAADFDSWSEDFIVKGNNGNVQEKSAAISYLDVNLKTELMSLRLQGVGIYRLEHNKLTKVLSNVVRVEASMYCEQAELVLPASPAAPAPDPPSSDSPNNLREFLGVRLGGDEVTRRLRESRDQPTSQSPSDRQRQLGFDLGIAWAERRASFDELLAFQTVEEEDWSSISLPSGHSLGQTLEATGAVPVQYDGPLELLRDSMVEGLLAGILKVLSEVSSDITQNLK